MQLRTTLDLQQMWSCLEQCAKERMNVVLLQLIESSNQDFEYRLDVCWYF